jgi:hypothetical protein
MFEDMAEPAFPEFLAAFWTEKGWETSVTENDDGTYLVAGDKDNGRRGLIGVRPSEDTEISASEIEDFAAFCEQKGVDVRVMATRGRFTTGARSAADSADVHLLDPNELASAVRDEGVEDLVGEYTGDGGGSGGLFAALPSVPLPVPSGLPSGIPVIPILVAAAVVAAAVFVGPTLLGAVPFVGSGGGGGASAGPPMTALSLSDANGTAATVQWDAAVTDTVGNYSEPANSTFVVVQLNASSTNGTVGLRSEHFALAANGTYYSVQSFTNMSQSFRATQPPVAVPAGGTGSGVLVFTVPEGFDGATLVETFGGPGLRFQRAELAFSVAVE